MARSGKSLGTVVRWDGERGRGLIESPDLPGECWVEASVVHHSTGTEALRAGQVVEVEWQIPADGGLHAVRVTPRDDLQATLGG
jgi:cold shock CspA family protein